MSGQTDMKRRIAANIALAMDQARVGPAELSRKTGAHERAIRRWRDGDVTPGEDNLSLLAVGLGITDIAWFYADNSPETAAA